MYSLQPADSKCHYKCFRSLILHRKRYRMWIPLMAPLDRPDFVCSPDSCSLLWCSVGVGFWGNRNEQRNVRQINATAIQEIWIIIFYANEFYSTDYYHTVGLRIITLHFIFRSFSFIGRHRTITFTFSAIFLSFNFSLSSRSLYYFLSRSRSLSVDNLRVPLNWSLFGVLSAGFFTFAGRVNCNIPFPTTHHELC